MEVGIAANEMARHAGPLGGLADFALLAPPILGDGTKAFGGLQLLGVPEFDFGGPDGAHNMSPVVTGGALQRLPRTDGFANSFLALAIELDGFGDHLLFESLLLFVSIRLLPTSVLCGFHQIMLGVCHWAKNTFVGGRDRGAAVVRAHIAEPLITSPEWRHSVTVAVNGQPTISAREMLVARWLDLVTDCTRKSLCPGWIRNNGGPVSSDLLDANHLLLLLRHGLNRCRCGSGCAWNVRTRLLLVQLAFLLQVRIDVDRNSNGGCSSSCEAADSKRGFSGHDHLGQQLLVNAPPPGLVAASCNSLPDFINILVMNGVFPPQQGTTKAERDCEHGSLIFLGRRVRRYGGARWD
jgi:hypothetical protein